MLSRLKKVDKATLKEGGFQEKNNNKLAARRMMH